MKERQFRGSLCVALAALAGCGAAEPVGNRKPVFPAAGQFLVDGAPADGALVTFHPPGGAGPGRGLPSQARANAEGKFQLTTYATADGAPEGEYVVTVYWPLSPSAAGGHSDDDEGSLPPDRLQGRFAAPGTSPLRARVAAKPTTFAPLDLATRGVANSRDFHLIEQ